MSGQFDRESNKVKYIFLLITVLLVGSIGYWVKLNGNYRTVVSTEGDFKIQVPKTWAVEYVEPNEYNPVYGFQAFDEASESTIFVVVNPLAKGDAATDVNQLAQVNSLFGFEFTKQEDRNLNGADGRYYEAKMNGITGQYYQSGFVTYENGKKYTLSMQVLSDNYEAQKSHFDKGLNSFKIEGL